MEIGFEVQFTAMQPPMEIGFEVQSKLYEYLNLETFSPGDVNKLLAL